MGERLLRAHSHSLQFFSFPSRKNPGRTVHTCLSHDIVAHETGHAILDGIAPALYDALSPQSLAIHEGVADLVALIMAFRSNKLRRVVLDSHQGSIDDTTAFSGIAEEFATASDTSGCDRYLRNLRNSKTLDPADPASGVALCEPHLLSEVLTGALYAVMLRIHAALRGAVARKRGTSPFSASGEALAVGVERFKRMALRALDYLPPGEVSFADYGRAILAADQASHPDSGQEREWIVEEFVRRKIVAHADELQVATNWHASELERVDLETLAESDWAAYEFANRHRAFLGIPPGIPFQVHPRLRASKLYYHRDGQRPIHDCLFKVSWDQAEPNALGPGLPGSRQVTFGTTLVIDSQTRVLRAMLHSDPGESLRSDRDRFLRRLLDEGLVRFGEDAYGPDGRPLPSVLRAESIDGLMRVRGTARLLHIVGDPL